MALPKGRHNSGIKNLEGHKFETGKSGYHFNERTVICTQCGKEFTTRGSWAFYCSEHCKEKSRPDKQKKDFVCVFCGKPFRRRSQDNAGRFCSRVCSGLHKIATGKQNYFYRAFLNYAHKCERCGESDYDVLCVHHRDHNHSNNEITNLEILCANCHYKHHFGAGASRARKLPNIIEFLRRKENATY